MRCLSRTEWEESLSGLVPEDVTENALANHLRSCSKCIATRAEVEREQRVLENLLTQAWQKRDLSRDAARASTSSSEMARRHSGASGETKHAQTFAAGEVIDGYVVIKVFPAGGFGQAYLVHREDRDRLKDRIVLKLLPPETREADLEDRGGYSVFRALRGIATEHLADACPQPWWRRRRVARIPLLPCQGQIQATEGIYILTEYCPGGSLRELLETHPNGVDARNACLYIRDILRAVCVLHDHGLAHNDIKPANIFLRDDGAVLGDYSLVSRRESIPRYGTPNYIAPERWEGKAAHRSDIFSIGITLFELVTGLAPDLHMDMPLTVDAELRSMIVKAKKYNPADRYASAASMLHDLDRYGLNQRWWPPEGITRQEARDLEETFVEALRRNLSARSPLISGKPYTARGDLNERSDVERVRLLVGEHGKQAILGEMPVNRLVQRAVHRGWRGRQTVLAGVCVSPLEELTRDGATTRLLTQNDLRTAAQHAAMDESAHYVIGVFGPCGWEEGCASEQGRNWIAFPIEKLEGTRWQADLDTSLLQPYKTIFDLETRDQKVQRTLECVRSRPELHEPDGTITLKEVSEAEGVDEAIVTEACEILCRQETTFEIIDLLGFGLVISRTGRLYGA